MVVPLQERPTKRPGDRVMPVPPPMDVGRPLPARPPPPAPRPQPRPRPARAVATASLLAWLAAAYLFVNEGARHLLTPSQSVYIAQPLLWGGLGLIGYAGWRTLPDRPRAGTAVTVVAAAAAAIQISLLVLAGLAFGFGNSPYASGALNVAKNLFYLLTLLAGIEMARAYLLRAWSPAGQARAFVGVVVLFAAAQTSTAQFGRLTSVDSAFETGGGMMLPGLAEGTVATLLSSIGGAAAAVTYRAALALFEWTSPILPSLDWPITALVGTVAPALALILIRDLYLPREPALPGVRPARLRRVWVVAAILAVALIWLQAGLFGVQPYVVVGQSMEPTYTQGDMVFVREVSPDALEVGDVIRFRHEGTPLVHRIIAASGDAAVFVTKGDNSATPDDPILAGQIEGRVEFHVPKIGLVPLGVRRLAAGFG